MVIQLSNNTRPIFDIKVNKAKVICLYDTGADISVWTGSHDMFECLFPNAELKNDKYKITGFGGAGELYHLYIVPEFCMQTESGNYIIKNFIIAVSNGVISKFDLVLCAGVFGKSRITIDKTLGKPEMIIECHRDVYTMISTNDGKSTTVFSQDEEYTENPLLRAAMRADIK